MTTDSSDTSASTQAARAAEQEPGTANEPEGPTNTGTGVHRRAEPGVPAPGTNQGKAEPGSAGQAHRTPGHQGESPNPIETDVEAGAARAQASVPGGPAPTPGDAAGVSVGGTEPLEGSSAESGAAEGVRTPLSATERAAGTPRKPAVAPRPSAPDGEVSPR